MKSGGKRLDERFTKNIIKTKSHRQIMLTVIFSMCVQSGPGFPLELETKFAAQAQKP